MAPGLCEQNMNGLLKNLRNQVPHCWSLSVRPARDASWLQVELAHGSVVVDQVKRASCSTARHQNCGSSGDGCGGRTT